MRGRLSRFVVVSLGMGILASGCSSSRLEEESSATAAISKDERSIATLRLDDYAGQMSLLATRGYDIAGVDIHASEVDLVVSRQELLLLEQQGFRLVREQAVPSVGATLRGEYRAPEDIDALVHDYAERYPGLTSLTSIGRSNEGRDIWALQIAKDAAHHAARKPAILFNASHHARELMTVEVALDTIDTLLTSYGTDAKVTHWVDTNEIWVVPMLNVDGNHRVWTDSTAWRKNARGCPATGSCRPSTGVDINRNYPAGWGSCNGSSDRPGAEDYRGPTPASEPETQAMMGLVDRIRPVFDISYHSYSELVLYPYGCKNQYVPSRALVEDIGAKMAARLPGDENGRPYKAGTPWELLYSADGGDMDWMYNTFAVVPFAIELNSSRQGFRPSFATWRTKTVTKARAAWQLLLDRLDGSAVRGVAHTADGTIVAGAKVEVVPQSGPVGTQLRTVNPDGSFHVVLLPGSYRVTVTAPEHAAVVTTVSVADTRVDLDVVLP
jgi:carboxypeptidase T